jgi:membrane-bound ClpP family serine protease
MDPLVWSILLLVAGLLLVLVEVFVPSGGIIGFLSLSSVLAAIVIAFYNRGLETGMIFLVAAAVGIPLVLSIGFRYWPQTQIGKRVLLEVPTESELLPDSPQRRALRKLVGKVGIAKSMMLPSGAITIQGQTVDAVTEGMAIEPGQRVEVIEVSGNRVVVRPADDRSISTTRSSEDDILSRPLDSLGLEDEPLA